MANSDGGTLPDPDFSWDPSANPPIAGLRPHRAKSYRLEPETFGTKFVVHNYGHGGAGITMSWGCAHEIIDIVSSHGVTPNQAVAVLGSGVMGLTAATLLSQLNLRVTIFAKAFPPHTTSNVAGGKWAPSLVEHSDTQQFDRILRRSFATHSSKIGQGYGVSTRLNYTPQRSPNFDVVPRDVISQPQFFNHLPFKHLYITGVCVCDLVGRAADFSCQTAERFGRGWSAIHLKGVFARVGSEWPCAEYRHQLYWPWSAGPLARSFGKSGQGPAGSPSASAELAVPVQWSRLSIPAAR